MSRDVADVLKELREAQEKLEAADTRYQSAFRVRAESVERVNTLDEEIVGLLAVAQEKAARVTSFRRRWLLVRHLWHSRVKL
jgi:hypothetical protein